MRRRIGFAIGIAVLFGGCSVIIEGQFNDSADGGPTGPPCSTTEQCLMLEDRVFDCHQLCVDGHCVTATTQRTPNGTECGTGVTPQICFDGTCIDRRCGDHFTDRLAEPPEYCDDGNTIDSDGCNNACTRRCEVPASPICADSDPCNGVESCDVTPVPDVCVVPTAPLAAGAACDDMNPCTRGATCANFRCGANEENGTPCTIATPPACKAMEGMCMLRVDGFSQCVLTNLPEGTACTTAGGLPGTCMTGSCR